MQFVQSSGTSTRKSRRRWLQFGLVMTGTFMINIDMSMLSVALPALQQAFHVGPDRLQWPLSAYLLTATGILPAVGQLSEVWDRKRLFALGILVFTIGSCLCALAPGLWTLVGCRVIQAVGGAIIMGVVMSIVAYMFPPPERGKAFGLNSSAVAAGTVAGPLAGGLFIARFGWQAAFLVNVPIGLVVFLSSLVFLPPMVTSKQVQACGHVFDYSGALSFFVAMSSLLLFVSNGQTWGWLSTVSLILGFIALLSWTLFIRHEAKIAPRGNPLIDLRLFQNGAYVLSHLGAYISFVCMMIVAFLLPLFLRQVLGLSIASIGLLLSPQAIAMIAVSPVGGWLSDKYGAQGVSVFGMAITAAGVFWMMQLDAHSGYASILGSLVVFGAGIGLFQSPNNAAVMEITPTGKAGVTAGLIATVRNFGRISGVAFAAVLFQAAGGAAEHTGIHPNVVFARAASGVFLAATALAVMGVLLILLRGKFVQKLTNAGSQ